MKRHFFFIWVGITLFLVGCQDSLDYTDLPLTNNASCSRSAYDSGYVEWDNVEHLCYKLQSDDIKDDLPLPWEPGSASNIGVPVEWIDDDLRNPDPEKRAYSQENGWRLVYCNLLDKAERNKYFGIYNRYTGILRMFFYAMEAYSGNGTSNTFIGLAVSGTTSLLNFSYEQALAMDRRQENPSTFFSPSCAILAGKNNASGIGYKSNTWYGIEIECAFDSYNQDQNRLMAKLWGTNVTTTITSGDISGSIKGNIQTTYSNNPNFELNINLESDSTEADKKKYNAMIQLSSDKTQNIIGDKMEEEVQKKTPFFTQLWNNIKKDVPGLALKGVKEGVKALFSGGTSAMTNALGKLVGNVFGIKSKPMTSTSKVDLGLTATISLNSNSETPVAGWGGISPFPLPGSSYPNNLFSEKLGVWNLSKTPVTYVDMFATSYFYPKELVPNPTKPRAFEIGLKYYLSPVELQLNPAIAQEFVVENLKQELVYTNSGGNEVKNGAVPYGLRGNQCVYQTNDSFIHVQDPIEDYVGNSYNPNTCYELEWERIGFSRAVQILCRVSFDLVAKDGDKVISFSKYFPTQGVRRNYYHEEATITKEIAMNEIFRTDAVCALMLQSLPSETY